MRFLRSICTALCFMASGANLKALLDGQFTGPAQELGVLLGISFVVAGFLVWPRAGNPKGLKKA